MVHLIFCTDTVDGIAAAAIVGRTLTLRGHDWRLANALPPVNESRQKLLSTKGQQLILCDIQPAALSEDDIKTLCSNNKVVYWCADFPTKESTVDMVASICGAYDIATARSPLCSAELAQRRFLPNDSSARSLAAMAHDIKQWKRSDESAARLADIIASGYDLRKLTVMLSKGVFWTESLELERQRYRERREKAIADMSNRLDIKDYVGVKFGFALCASFVTSADACSHILETHAGVDVACVIFRDGRIAFRRRDGIDVDLCEIASLFDGGGREYASGGSLGAQVSNTNYEQVIFSVDRKLKDHFFR